MTQQKNITLSSSTQGQVSVHFRGHYTLINMEVVKTMKCVLQSGIVF